MTRASAPLPTAFAPRLAPDATVHRHCYRETPWYLVHDRMTGRCLHLAEGAWRVVGAMNGERSIQHIAAHLQSRHTPVSVDGVRAVCAELLRAGLLAGASSEHTDTLPLDTTSSPRWKQWLASPLSVRLPLINPGKWLDRRLAVARPAFTSAAFWLWVTTIIYGMALAIGHFDALADRFSTTVMSPHGLLVFLGVYVGMKTLHELAHALSIRAFGGTVSEMGLMFLVFMPVPYVDASAATTFASKRQRMIVSSAGIMVEALISTFALLLWLNIEPGIVREICFAAVVIGGVSTLLFNGNPLLRFDGYYVLSDALEIPNLAARSRRYLAYLFQHYLLRLNDIGSPVVTASERGWLVAYGVLSCIYRLVILGVIVWFVSREVPLVGYALAAWVILSQLVLPAGRGVANMIRRAKAGPRPHATLVRLGATGSALLLLLFGLPFPAWSSAEGVVWMPPDVQVRANVSGTVTETLLADVADVDANQAIVRLSNPQLVSDAAVIEQQLDEIEARRNLALFRDRSRLGGVSEQLVQTREQFEEARTKIAALTVRSPSHGALHYLDHRSLAGRFVHKGDVLGYVRDDRAPVVRVVVRQNQIERLRNPDTQVRVLIPGYFDQAVTAQLVNELGATTQRLPSAALGSAGGGRIATDMVDVDQRTAAEDIFVVAVQLADGTPEVAIGTRVYLRFDYTPRSLAQQMLRSLRLLTLGSHRA